MSAAAEAQSSGRVLPRAAALPAAALILCWPAFLNGYPLVFADSGTYVGQALQHYLGWDRPAAYSALLAAIHLRLTLWTPVLVQGLVTAWVLSLALRAAGRRRGEELLAAAALLALLTGLPWFVAQLMPDIFTGLLVLALWLRGFARNSLSRWERRGVVLIALVAAAVHLTHVPLGLGLALAGALLQAALEGWRAGGRCLLRMGGPVAVAAAAIVAVNTAGHGQASLSPYGSVFLAARLLDDGPARATLEAECPAAGWRICAARDRLPQDADHFLWDRAAPLWTEFDGPKTWAPEARALVVATLSRAPLESLAHMAANTARQALLVDTGDGLEPWPAFPGPAGLIAEHFPRELAAFQGARQQRGLLREDAAVIAPLHRAVAGLGLFAALLAATELRRRRAAATLCVLVLAAALGNAALTGALSGPHHRYQARIAWLFALAPGLVLATRLQRDDAARPG